MPMGKSKGQGRGEYSTKNNPKPTPKKGSSLGITSWSPQSGKVQSMIKKTMKQPGC